MFRNETPFCDLGQPTECVNISVDIYTHQKGTIVICRSAVGIKGDAQHTEISSGLDLKKVSVFFFLWIELFLWNGGKTWEILKLIVTECYYWQIKLRVLLSSPLPMLWSFSSLQIHLQDGKCPGEISPAESLHSYQIKAAYLRRGESVCPSSLVEAKFSLLLLNHRCACISFHTLRKSHPHAWTDGREIGLGS